MDTKKRGILSLRNITKTYVVENKVVEVLKSISFDVFDNEFLVILGPGHCGKTVLLNLIAGLEKPLTGDIFLAGQKITGADSRISMVFQNLALLPWKTVMGNVEIGPLLAGIDKKTRREKAQKFIDLVRLSGFESYYINQLSGGMKQRVGIARAYTNDPEILLMDEPFGQLDAQTRYYMQEEIQRIWLEEKRTVVFVTNNIEEAIFLGDRIVLLSKAPGKIKEIYDIDLPRPRDTVSPEFLDIRRIISQNTDLAI